MRAWTVGRSGLGGGVRGGVEGQSEEEVRRFVMSVADCVLCDVSFFILGGGGVYRFEYLAASALWEGKRVDGRGELVLLLRREVG